MRRTGIVRVAIVIVAVPAVAVAQEAAVEGPRLQPSDYFYLMWFLSFFLFALVGLLVALRRGWLRDVESAKYYMMEIDEPDYYTPEWVKEAMNGSDTDRQYE